MSARRPSAACTFIPMATPNGGLPRASREAARAAMRQWIEANGRLPAWSEWEYAVDGRHSAKTLDRRWGWDSFRAAAAGVPRRRLHGLKVRAHRLQRSWLDAHRAAATADGPLRARGPVADRQAMGSRDGRTPLTAGAPTCDALAVGIRPSRRLPASSGGSLRLAASPPQQASRTSGRLPSGAADGRPHAASAQRSACRPAGVARWRKDPGGPGHQCGPATEPRFGSPIKMVILKR